jgi:hypothetical protein
VLACNGYDNDVQTRLPCVLPDKLELSARYFTPEEIRERLDKVWRKDRNNRGTHAARTTHITEMSRCKDKSHPSDDELTDAATDQDFGFSVTPLTAWRTLVPWATRRSVDAAAWQASTAKRGDNSLDRAKWGVKYASLSASLDSPPYHSMYFDSHQPTFLLSSSHNSWSPLLHYTCLPSP